MKYFAALFAIFIVVVIALARGWHIKIPSPAFGRGEKGEG